MWMADGRRSDTWKRTAIAVCAISNPWRGRGDTLQPHNFPYCDDLRPRVRMATKREFEAFAKLW